MSSGFLVWRDGELKDGICKLMDIMGPEDTFEISEGVSRAEGWGTDAYLTMDPDFPKDIGLADSLSAVGTLVVSKKVKEFLAGEAVGNVEFLPVKIMNHM